MRHLNPFTLNLQQIDFYHELFTKFVREKANYDLKLNEEGLEYVDGWLGSAHERLKNGDLTLDLTEIGGSRMLYSEFLVAGAGSYIAKLIVKETGAEIITGAELGKHSEIKQKTHSKLKVTAVKHKDGNLFPWAWVGKQIEFGESDSVAVKYKVTAGIKRKKFLGWF